MIRDLTLEQQIQHTVLQFRREGAFEPFQWASDQQMESVASYLHRWKAHDLWHVILAGGVRGYSLFLHEWVEVDGYRRINADQCDFDQQTAHYDRMHARALLVEHRFLQVVAKLLGYEFTLRELVTLNPHGDEPDDEWPGDWKVLLRELPQELPRPDRKIRRDCVRAVREFYRLLGFERV